MRRLWRGGLLAVLALAGPGLAQEIDYDLLFERHADEVQHPAPGEDWLELPGPVIVQRRDGMVTAIDQSAAGAAGCAVRVLTAGAGLARLCPGMLDEAQTARLQRLLLLGWRFQAANTVPAMSEAEMAEAMAMQLDAHAEWLGVCPPDDSAHGQDIAQMLRSILRAENEARVEEIFAEPRLPVTNPCL